MEHHTRTTTTTITTNTTATPPFSVAHLKGMQNRRVSTASRSNKAAAALQVLPCLVPASSLPQPCISPTPPILLPLLYSHLSLPVLCRPFQPSTLPLCLKTSPLFTITLLYPLQPLHSLFHLPASAELPTSHVPSIPAPSSTHPRLSTTSCKARLATLTPPVWTEISFIRHLFSNFIVGRRKTRRGKFPFR